jgi:acyl-CoA synthetase (NDP forming)
MRPLHRNRLSKMAPTRIANAAAAAVPITCDDGFSALFAPRSVAVVGASSDPLRFGGKPIRYMRDAAFAGPIYPINPTRAEIQGLRAYASLEAVDGDIDCALLAVSTEAKVP